MHSDACKKAYTVLPNFNLSLAREYSNISPRVSTKTREKLAFTREQFVLTRELFWSARVSMLVRGISLVRHTC